MARGPGGEEIVYSFIYMLTRDWKKVKPGKKFQGTACCLILCLVQALSSTSVVSFLASLERNVAVRVSLRF